MSFKYSVRGVSLAVLRHPTAVAVAAVALLLLLSEPTCAESLPGELGSIFNVSSTSC